ncbi:Ni/Fe hydrogenase [Clostridium botulinum]|uniref:nickel-dependent hydrogenase large subunit n=1 Tax=Clostridium botulinum TaxID=1491 RepID=UPI000773D24A|nr:nickel-dependent hydrogenase large subunit [Clostridium botulinum]NFL87264.1 Ni/Fe hydrogenase [Clostridium botulinum]NFO22770.1 Ni/Fe hydrogenase [Clostridium botulinum]HBJ2621983.1 nickel-dependent hydrogenase large subunit [Clostridium botulinum]
MAKIVIDPVTRISGLLKIEVDVENNKIVDAKSTGSQFRGFEKMFQGRPPLDIIRLAPRICGICSTSHAIAATLALENALNITPDFNGKVIRDIAHGFEFLQNHLRTTYFFAFPDFVKITASNPLYKDGTDKELDYRLPTDITKKINEDYLEAIKYSRECHRAIAVLAGKAPHCHGIWVGGISTYIDVPEKEAVKYTITVVKEFIENKLLEDVKIIAQYYNDYFNMGKGYGNLMDFGLYSDYKAPIKYTEASAMINGKKENIDVNNITENVKYSYLDIPGGMVMPGVSSTPEANPYKQDAYSWVDAARYKNYSMEGGPLARQILNGYYENKISAMDRILARVLESVKICESIIGLIDLMKLGQAVQEEWKIPSKANGIGLTGAPRGDLGHWLSIENKQVSNYTLIPPSAWNLSPTDSNNIKGPVEEALIGTEINDMKNPVEIGRIVRSFDPCSNCAAHVTSDRYDPIVINIV